MWFAKLKRYTNCLEEQGEKINATFYIISLTDTKIMTFYSVNKHIYIVF
jgi:hypothetical protein